MHDPPYAVFRQQRFDIRGGGAARVHAEKDGTSVFNLRAPLVGVCLRHTGLHQRRLQIARYLAGDMLGASRILFAFGRDRLLPHRLAAVHPVTRAPHVALLVHGLAAAALAMTGSFAVLAPIASVAIIVVYLACCAAALVLVRRPAQGPAPKRVAALAPVLAMAGLLWILSHSTRQEFLAVGAVLVAGGAIYWLGTRLRRASTA